jgi:WD40 repeat protein/serine/threonine protein kinase
MRIDSLTDLTEALRQGRLLEPTQLHDLSEVQSQFPEPKALARELVRRGWLTPFQVNALFQGRGGELLLGSYVLLDKLGEGGMGAVYKARNRKLGRTVALKVIRPERLGSEDAVRRFQREIRAAAQLSHPNVVAAYDADEVNGTLLFAMEHVEGTDLARLVKQQGPLPVPEACDYVRQAALGLQHAFERGLVHRDVKPHNLLVTRQGVVKVLDLGLALLGPSGGGEESSTMTQEGAVMGTPDYMAPEQTLDSHRVDIRADLYSLGCTLYHLLAGRPPFAGGTLGEKIAKHQMQEPVPVEERRPEVPPPVAATVRRLMAKRPGDRYQTPAELAAALAGQGGAAAAPPKDTVVAWPSLATPSLAAGPGSVRGSRRPEEWRRPLLFSAAGAGVLVGLAGLLFALLWLVSSLSRPPGPALAENRARGRADGSAPAQPSRAAPEAPGAAPAARDVGPQATLQAHPDVAWGVAFAPDGGTLATAGGDRTVKLWTRQGNSWQLRQTLQGHQLPVRCVAYCPDGKTLASGSFDTTIKLWDTATGQERATFRGHAELVNSLAFAPDGMTLASGSLDGTVKLWDVKAGRQRATLSGHAGCVLGVAFSADGGTLASSDRPSEGGGPGVIKLWDVASRKELATLQGHEGWVEAVAFAPDRNLLASASHDRTVRLWEAATGQPQATLRGPEHIVVCLAFAPTGKLLASAGEDEAVWLWDPATAQAKAVLRGHHRPVRSVAFAPDGKTLATADDGGVVNFWDVSR